MSNTSEDKSSSDLLKEAALQSLNSSGQFTAEEREAIASAVAAGVQRFRQRMLENLEKSTGKSLLRAIAEVQGQLLPGQTVDDAQLAKKMGSNLQSIREDLARIEADGYIELERTAKSWLILLTPQGQEILRDNEP